MPSTLRQQIFDAVLVGFRNILTANGYVSDIGRDVYAWRDLNNFPFEAANLEAISVKDTEEDGETVITRHHDKTLNIEVLFGTNVSSDSQTVIERLRVLDADIDAAIGADRTWGGLAQDTMCPEKTEYELIQSGRIVAGGRKNFKIKYRHQFFDQYTA